MHASGPNFSKIDFRNVSLALLPGFATNCLLQFGLFLEVCSIKTFDIGILYGKYSEGFAMLASAGTSFTQHVSLSFLLPPFRRAIMQLVSKERVYKRK